MAKRSIAVRISGQEYKIRSEADAAWLQKVAAAVDDVMGQVRERTGIVDTLEVALLTSLNLAQEVIRLRQRVAEVQEQGALVDGDRIAALVEVARAAMAGAGEPEDAELFTLPSKPPAAPPKKNAPIDPLIAAADQLIAEQGGSRPRAKTGRAATRGASRS